MLILYVFISSQTQCDLYNIVTGGNIPGGPVAGFCALTAAQARFPGRAGVYIAQMVKALGLRFKPLHSQVGPLRKTQNRDM